jgi:hypothetical protein
VTVGTLNQSTTGSAATLTTPRAIGGVNFDGSADINLPGVNAAGNQATSGLAATATLATTVTCTDNAANETVYPTFVDGATGAQDLETDTGLNYNPSTGLLSAVGLTLSGDLTVNGTNTILNTATLEVEDKDIVLAKVSSPSNTTANGAGIIIEAGTDTDKSILWDSTNSNFTSTEHVNIATGKKFKINNVDTLTATALGTNVVGSSLTSVGTIGTGTWQGDAIAQAYIGADAINGDKIANNAVDSEHITAGAVDIAHLSATGTASSTTFLRGDGQWQSAGGGTNTTVDCLLIDNADTNTVVPTYSTRTENSTSTPIQIYVQTIDSNNEGVYIRVKKNGTYTNVQIA